ncbi:MAG: type II secretion system F family protein [Nitrosomonas halophila]
MDNPTNLYIISFLAFLAAVALVEGLYLVWRSLNVEQTVKINRRIRALSAGGAHGEEVLQLLRHKELSSVPWLNRVLSAIPRFHTIDRMIEQAGVDLSVSRYLAMQIGIALLTWVLITLLTNFYFLVSVLIAIAVGLFLPHLYILRKRRARQAKFAEQLPDAMDYLARSMRAGNPFMASLRSGSRELPDPTGTEFGITFDELNYGLELEDALNNLGVRSGSDEMRFFITAVLIQKATGGNLADVLNKIASVMRARATTFRDIQILAAEMKYSANVLIALPFFVAAALTVLNPSYLQVLFEHTLGLIIIGAQLFLMLVGYIVIQRMINFRV